MTTQIFSPIKDTYVRSGTNASRNYGTGTVLYVGYDYDWYESYLQFNINIPSGATISSAKLMLTESAYSHNYMIQPVSIDSDWEESVVNWNIKPTVGNGWVGVETPDNVNADGYDEFDVTDLVIAWVNGTIVNRGVGLRLAPSYGTPATEHLQRYASSSNTSYKTPQLVVSYTIQPTKPLSFTGTINTTKGTTEYLWSDASYETKYQLREIVSGVTPNSTGNNGDGSLIDPIVLDNIPANVTNIPYEIVSSWSRTESNSTNGSIVLTGTWLNSTATGTSGGHIYYSNTLNNKIKFSFSGRKVRWIGMKHTVAGIADVYLDGSKVATVDCYGSTSHQQVLYESPILSSGTHNIEIVVTSTKNTSSTDSYIYVDAFDLGSVDSISLSYDSTKAQITRYLLAINADGTSEPSNIVTLYPPPVAPSSFQITHIKSTSVDCSWTDNSNNETGFKIYNRVGSQPNTSTDTLLKTATTSPITVTGLTEGQTYNLYVVSYNNTGNSTASEVRTVTPSANLSRNFTLNYDILSPIQKSIDFTYDIRNQVSRELEIVYNLNKEPVENSLSIKYDIYGNEQFKLGKYKLGQKILSEAINTSFFDLVETITLNKDPQAAVYNLTEGIVIYRSSTRNLTEYFNAIYKSSLYDITETLTVKTFSEYDLSESILIKADSSHNLTETISVVFTGQQDLTEDINIYYDGKLDISEDITVRGQGNFDLTENINLVLNEGFNLTETISLYKLGLRNLDETLTIIAERKFELPETIKVVYSGQRDLTETIDIVTNNFSLLETLTVKSLGIDGIILYKDAQHTQVVDNDVYSFIFDFGTVREEEKIYTFYLLNNKPTPLTNLWVKIEVDGLKNKYNQNMFQVSSNALDWNNSSVLIASSLSPQQSGQFSIKIHPKLGIDEESNINIRFAIFTR